MRRILITTQKSNPRTMEDMQSVAYTTFDLNYYKGSGLPIPQNETVTHAELIQEKERTNEP